MSVCDPGTPRQFFGKYRGTVRENVDLENLHRLLVDVPALAGLELSWALPCVPYAGIQVGFCMLPPKGANVWVEFEGGDPTHPIWSGCFWAVGEKPPIAATPFTKVLKTDSCTLVINDMEGGGILLTVQAPAIEVPVTVQIDAMGIQVSTAAASMSMSPDAITAGIPTTTATLAAAGIAVSTEGTISIDADSTLVVSDVTMNGEVVVNGSSDFNGAVDVEGAVAIEGATSVTGEMSVEGGVEVGGDMLCGALEAGDVTAGAIEAASVSAGAVEVAVP